MSRVQAGVEPLCFPRPFVSLAEGGQMVQHLQQSRQHLAVWNESWPLSIRGGVRISENVEKFGCVVRCLYSFAGLRAQEQGVEQSGELSEAKYL